MKKNPVFSILTAVFFVLIIGIWIYMRTRFYIVTPEASELLKQSESFLDGMSEASFFYSPSPAGTVEAYSAIFNVTGVNATFVKYAVIILEAVCGALLFFLSKSILGVFYAFFCLIVMSILPFFGLQVSVYEELPVVCLLLFEVMLSLTRKYEKTFPESGPFIIRYLFVGVTGGLAVFLMSGNIVIVVLSLIISLYFLLSKRKLSLLIEYLIALFGGAAIFFLLITVRVMNTALPPLSILNGYGRHLLDNFGSLYLFTALLLMILFIIEVITDLLWGKKAEAAAGSVDTADKDNAAAGAAVAANGDKAGKPQQDAGNGKPQQRPVSTGSLPGDFVLHRAGSENKDIVASNTAAAPKPAGNTAAAQVSSAGTVAGNSNTAGSPAGTVNAAGGNAPGVNAAAPTGAVNTAAAVNAATVANAVNAVNAAATGEARSIYAVKEAIDTLYATVAETEEDKEKRIAAYRKYAENINPNDLEFDFDIPADDDFDVEVTFD